MTTEQSFNSHPLVDFVKLITGHPDEILRLETEFQSNGWCFIRLADLDGHLVKKLADIEHHLTSFFSEDRTVKSRYKSSTAFGYSRVGHKEGIKVLTDQHGLGDHHQHLTGDVERALQSLAFLMRHLTDVIQSVIFKMPTMAQSPARRTVELSPLTMLDIVHYYNKRTGPATQPAVGYNTDEVNCVPHFDPGLFSLSILSTCEGLQLKDQRKDQWVDGPITSVDGQSMIGVVWLGEAASLMTENRFKAGIHRVVYPHVPRQPRLTIWQEVCTVAQVDPLLIPGDHAIRPMSNHVRSKQVQQVTNAVNFLPDGASVTMTNQPNSKPLRVKKGGEPVDKFMKRVESERGLSMSKSGRRHIRAAPEDNDTQDVQLTSNADFLPDGASVTMTNQPNSKPLRVKKGGEPVDKFMKRVESERGLSMSKSGRRHIRAAPEDNDTQDVQLTSNANFLPDGASVTMTNQPNSKPLRVKKGGEPVDKFMKRVESERGLSESKSGIEHLDVEIPFAVKKSADQPQKKRSLLSKLFN